MTSGTAVFQGIQLWMTEKENNPNQVIIIINHKYKGIGIIQRPGEEEARQLIPCGFVE